MLVGGVEKSAPPFLSLTRGAIHVLKRGMLSCSKSYRDIPFAHRQWRHKGHCAEIHGHNWTFEFEFRAAVLDDCDFIVDFGKLKELKAFLMEFDHALVLNKDDPCLPDLQKLLCSRIIVLDSCSCEGLCRYVYVAAATIVDDLTDSRAWVHRVTIWEDSKNSATYVKQG